MRTRFTREGLLVPLAIHFTTRGTQVEFAGYLVNGFICLFLGQSWDSMTGTMVVLRFHFFFFFGSLYLLIFFDWYVIICWHRNINQKTCFSFLVLKYFIWSMVLYFLSGVHTIFFQISLFQSIFMLCREYNVLSNFSLFSDDCNIIIIIMINKVKLATVVEGDQKAPFSRATTPRRRERRYSFPWIDPFSPWYVPYIAEC